MRDGKWVTGVTIALLVPNRQIMLKMLTSDAKCTSTLDNYRVEPNDSEREIWCVHYVSSYCKLVQLHLCQIFFFWELVRCKFIVWVRYITGVIRWKPHLSNDTKLGKDHRGNKGPNYHRGNKGPYYLYGKDTLFSRLENMGLCLCCYR